MPDGGPSAPMFGMLCDHLARRGHHITVVAAVPHYPSGQVPAQYRRGFIQPSQEDGVQVIRVRVPSVNRGSLPHRLLQFFVYQLGAAWVCLKLKYDIALVTNPALESWLPFFVLEKMRRKPSVFCVWDLYPEVGIEIGIFHSPFVIRFVKNLEDFCLEQASLVQSLTTGFVPHLRDRVSNPDKITVIAPWLDTGFVRPLPRKNSFSNEYGLASSFVVLYAGNIGLSQGLENVLAAAEMLKKQNDIQFVLVGDGAARANLEDARKKRRITNVRFIPFQPRASLPDVLATADISLIMLKAGISSGSLPSKSFSILASGRPVIASVDENSDTWKLVKRAKAGLCIPPENPQELVRAILSLKNAPNLQQRLGINGRLYVERYHSPKSASEQFEKLLLSIGVRKNV